MIKGLHTIRHILPLLLALLLPATAVQAKEHGALNIVNLVNSKDKTFIDIGGLAVSRQGMAQGKQTSGLLLESGKHTLVVKNAAIPEPLSLTIQIETGKSPVVVIYDAVEQMDGESIRVLKAQKAPSMATTEENRLGLLNSFGETMTVKVGKQELTLENLQSARAEWTGGMISVRRGEDTIAHYNPDQVGSYLVLIYRKPNGTPGGTVVRDVNYDTTPIESDEERALAEKAAAESAAAEADSAAANQAAKE